VLDVFGVAGDLVLAIALVSRWACAAMACAKSGGLSEENLFKNAKGRLYYFLICPTFYFFKVQVVTEPFNCPRGKILLGSRQPFCLKTNLSRPYGWQRLCFCSGALPKPRPVPEPKRDTKIKTYSLHFTAPLQKHCVLVAQLLYKYKNENYLWSCKDENHLKRSSLPISSYRIMYQQIISTEN
jgi:hypothetical protein